MIFTETNNSIEFQKSESGQIVVCRQGRILCSIRDPLKEAKDWLGRQKIALSDQKLVILGLGAGYHVQELRSQFPDAEISIIEFDENLKKMTSIFPSRVRIVDDCGNLSQFSNSDAILAFRPAWQGFEAQYSELYLNLTGRNRKSFHIQAEKRGLASTSSFIGRLPKQLTFSVKTLNFLESEESHFEVKMWKCLRELVE